MTGWQRLCREFMEQCHSFFDRVVDSLIKFLGCLFRLCASLNSILDSPAYKLCPEMMGHGMVNDHVLAIQWPCTMVIREPCWTNGIGFGIHRACLKVQKLLASRGAGHGIDGRRIGHPETVATRRTGRGGTQAEAWLWSMGPPCHDC